MTNAVFNFKENHQFLADKIKQEISGIKDLWHSTIKVEKDGWIDFDIDLEPKSETFGELGYRHRVCGLYHKYSESEIIKFIKEEIQDFLKKEQELFDKATTLFNQKYEGKEKPVRRDKAIAYKVIYMDDLLVPVYN